jgi:Protein of unknown function (DUF2380)
MMARPQHRTSIDGRKRPVTEGQEEGLSRKRLVGSHSLSAAASLLCAAVLAALPARADTVAPIKLAVFDFELEDSSAAATSEQAPADAARLTEVTTEVRQLFAHSGRYSLVDTGAADTPVAKAHTLSRCNGCDVAIALKLGAEQSFVGVVKRITRTEYVVRFEIRDAGTGDIVSAANSGLRMGADYSWGRGAMRLIKDRLLEVQDRR